MNLQWLGILSCPVPRRNIAAAGWRLADQQGLSQFGAPPEGSLTDLEAESYRVDGIRAARSGAQIPGQKPLAGGFVCLFLKAQEVCLQTCDRRCALKIIGLAAAMTMAATAMPASAAPIIDGETVNYSVPGAASIYQIFGHAGNPGGDYGPAQDAVLTTFLPGAGNIFTFSATGLVNCCGGGTLDITPDGGGPAMSVGGANGLSSLTGDANIPLVGVFTADADPFGGSAPAALSFVSDNPVSLSPLLHQVFYIGDGKSGNNDPLGSTLTFSAPDAATRLYIGAIDAYSYSGTTGYYNDNRGEWNVNVTLSAAGAVPEPSTWAMMLLGFVGLGGALRAQRRNGQAHAVFA